MKIEDIRKDFPILNQLVNDEPLIYLDNAATTQKPIQVLETMMQYYETMNANVHRGVHTLAQRATEAYEASRQTCCHFINACSTREILFTRGTTTGLNWVAQSYAMPRLQVGDEIWISLAEHHSNFVPWQQVAKKTGATLKFVPLTAEGEVDYESLSEQLTLRSKVMSIAHATNVLGTVNDIQRLAIMIHQVGGILVVDGAQAAPHLRVDVQKVDCDFYAFSGHKMLGPTGIGVLYGKEDLLKDMNPVEFGGEMIDFVYDEDSTWNELPWKFEAGTPNIAGGIALGSALSYLTTIGMDTIYQHEQSLIQHLMPRLRKIEGVTIFGPTEDDKRSGVVSFALEGIHPHDIATALDMQGIAVRAGHHCAQPLMRQLGVSSTVRASLYLYNTKAEIDAFIAALYEVKEYFSNGFI